MTLHAKRPKLRARQADVSVGPEDMAAMVREAREAAGLSQQQLAVAIGNTAAAMISRIEHGKTVPGIGVLAKIAEATKTVLVVRFEAQS